MKSSSWVRSVATAGIAAVVVAATLVAVGESAGAVPARTNWSPLATKALQLKHATLLEQHTSSSAPLRLTIGLSMRNQARLTKLIKQQNTPGSKYYRQYLKPGQFTRQFGATAAQTKQAKSYLRKAGFRHVTVSPNRLQITATASPKRAERAFSTNIATYRQFGHRVLANTEPAMVPASLRGIVTSVVGLSTLGFTTSTPSLPKLTGFYPKEFPKVYDALHTRAGTGQSMAIIAEGDLTSTIKDLRTAEAKQHLPVTPVSLVYTGPKSTDTAGADEWDLDSQTSTGVAPSVSRLYFYVATSLSDADLARAITKWVTDDKAKAASASLGECDVLPYLDGSMLLDDMTLEQAAAQGQTFFASSGDTGSSCAVVGSNGVPGSGPTDTEYPASSPYTVGVGGTTLAASSSDVYQTEIAWNAGGGGISPVENSPYWQTNAIPSGAAGARGVPDIAFDADPNTGAQIYVGGTPETIGGTSLSSPMALGMWTRLQSTLGGKLGFAAPKLYRLYTSKQTSPPLPPSSYPGFHDVTVGANGMYTALPGYDYTTGLGSFDVDQLATALK